MQFQLPEFSTPADALRDLCADFIAGGPAALDGRVVSAEQVPPPFHGLLAHAEEMTLKLGAFHATPIALRVLDQHTTGDVYRRRIVLTAGVGGAVVELGLVRLLLPRVPPAVAAEIRRGELPLGRVLIDHRVERRIEPRWYLQFPVECGPLTGVGLPPRGPLYGRVARIHCNGHPAIDLLEIVGGDKEPS